MPEPDVKPGYVDACAQIARCHRHQWPQDYGFPEVPTSDLNSPANAELVRAMFNTVPVDDTVVVPYDDGGWA